jgi:hypothetical protein
LLGIILIKFRQRFLVKSKTALLVTLKEDDEMLDRIYLWRFGVGVGGFGCSVGVCWSVRGVGVWGDEAKLMVIES